MGENKIISKQHVQVPNDMTKHSDLEPRDLHVYATIKRHLNRTTQECFPSLACLAKESGYSIPTIQKSISILKKLDYIRIRKDGRKNVYSFNAYKNFEPFSYKFLDNPDLSPNEIAYVIGSQQHQFKDIEGIGKMSYSNEEHAKLLNISASTVSRLDKSLIEKGYLSVVKTRAKDSDSGIMFNEKFFKLDELGQEIIWALQRHENDINYLKESSESISKDMKIVLRELDELKKREKERDELLKQNGIDINSLTNNSVVL